ncbi:MAG TPA: hypothetical protein VMY36_02320 [Patescibacteria group bacterium]|nr:hypothetical protein [Patescibacteria group bacterium]
MKLKNLPYWLVSGVMIFPVLIVLGLLFGLITGGKISILFWMVIPSIIFEEIFETCCRAFSDNFIFNVLFVGIFWFGIGSLTGLLAERIKKLGSR